MRMKSQVIAVAAAVAVAVLSVVGASADQTTIQSQIRITAFPETDSPPDGTPDSVSGILESQKPKCLSRRTVKIYWIGNTDRPKSSLILIDTVRSNAEGEWHGGDVEPIGHGGKVRVVAKNIGPDGHRHICAADSDRYD